MKFKRFISVFLLCTCLTGLFLTPAAGALEVPDIQAKAALLADVNTDAVAYAKNIHEKNYPASLTKVMTALLILEKVSGNETLLNRRSLPLKAPSATPITTRTAAAPGSRPGRS